MVKYYLTFLSIPDLEGGTLHDLADNCLMFINPWTSVSARFDWLPPNGLIVHFLHVELEHA